MALTIIKSPPTLIAARMPVVFQLTTDYTSLCHITGMVGTIGDSIEPDTAHKVTFELSDFVRDKPVLPASLTVPGLHAQAFPLQAFVFGERYGTPPTSHNELTTSEYRIMPARIPHWKHDFSGTINDYIVAHKPFLTWYPNQVRKVLPAEIIHLYYMVQDSVEYLYQLQFTVTYTDGTTAVFEGAYSGQAGEYEVVQLDASPAIVLAWALTDEPTKTVAGYTVRAAYINDLSVVVPVSETRTFVINRLPYTNPRQLFFRNSYGTFDQLMLRGLGIINATTDRLTASRQAGYDGAQVPDRVTWYNQGRQTLAAETGYMLKAETAWSNELLTSTEIYEVQGAVLVPVELRTEKMQQLNDDNALISVALEFEYLQTPVIESV